jgi:membrane protein DedA with SNARE-associated domain
MEVKTIMAIVLVVFIVGAWIWLRIRKKNKK